MTLELLSQISIIVVGITSVFLLSGKRTRKLGFAIAILGQWAWTYTTYHNAQWGLFLMTFYYLAMQIRGLKNNWHERWIAKPNRFELVEDKCYRCGSQLMIKNNIPGIQAYLTCSNTKCLNYDWS